MKSLVKNDNNSGDASRGPQARAVYEHDWGEGERQDPHHKYFSPSSMKRSHIYGALAILVAVAALAMVPISERRILSFGTDSFKTHRPIFGTRTISQSIDQHTPLLGIGVIAVDLHRSQQISPLIITIKNTQGTPLREFIVPAAAIRDDSFVWVRWDENISPHNDGLIAEFSSPQAIATTAIGLRYEESSNNLALGVVTKTPTWQVLVRNITQKSSQRVLAISVVASIALALICQLVASHKVARRLLLALIIIIASVTRIAYIIRTGGVSGGDPYNYLFITQQIASLENPFANTKRLPGFPLILLPAYLTPLDDIRYMQGLSILSSAACLLLVTAIAKTLRLPWAVQVLTVLLVAFQKDFFIISTRPEPYTFYAALLLACIYLFLNRQTPRNQILFGVALGYAALTRQEGFVLAAVLGVCALFDWRSIGVKGLARAFLPALAIVSPFFLHNTLTYGNPIFTPYFEGDRLQIVNSIPAFFDSLQATIDILGSLWKPSLTQLTRTSLTHPAFFFGVLLVTLIGLADYLKEKMQQTHHRLAVVLLITTSLLTLIWSIISSQHHVEETITHTLTGALFISPLIFVLRTGYNGIVIMSVVLTQILVALWFHPFAKHYQQDYPLLLLALTVAVASTTLSTKNRFSLTTNLLYLVILFPIMLMTVPLYRIHDTYIDHYNQTNALDSIVYRGVKAALAHPPPYGTDRAYLPARLYFADNGHYFEIEDPSTIAQQQQWLTDNNIRTMVTTNTTPHFMKLSEEWQLVATFKSENRDEKVLMSNVYTRQN